VAEPPILGLTIDVEWCPDPLVDECVELVTQAGAKATLFATDYRLDRSGKSTHLSKRGYGKNIEIALHPKFVRHNDFGETFDSIKQIYPTAKGFRSHNTLTGYEVGRAAVAHQLSYGSNYYIPYRVMEPFLQFAQMELIEFPVNFIDYQHAALSRDFDLHTAFNGAGEGVFVLDFHPSFIFANIPSLQLYQMCKSCYHDADALRKLRYQGKGTRTLFKEVLAGVQSDRFGSDTMSGLNDFWVKKFAALIG